jgi:hypothetical protein
MGHDGLLRKEMFMGTMQKVSIPPAPSTDGWAELRLYHFPKVLPLLALNRVRELLSPTNRGFRAKGGFVLSALGSLGGCGFKDKPSEEPDDWERIFRPSS